MSRFLRNAIALARDPGASLQPCVPSLYAELGGRGRGALEVEPLTAASVASTGDGLAGFVPTRSPGATEEERIVRRPHGPPGESLRRTGEPEMRSATIDVAHEPDPAPGAPLPRVVEDATRRRGPLLHTTATPREDAQRASNTPDGAPATSDVAAGAPAEVHRPPLARSSRHDSGDFDARALREPLLGEPWHAAQARSSPVTTSSQRLSDVEIHIGRIEVIAAAPTVRAPPQSTHKSPSLGDYLNGRRGRRP